MKWLPRTLFGQIALALFAGLLVVQLAGFLLLLDDRSQLNHRILVQHAAQRFAGLATVFEGAAPDERAGLVRALSVQPTTITLGVPWAVDGVDRSDEARNFVAAVVGQMSVALDFQVLEIERVDPAFFGLPAYRDKKHEPARDPSRANEHERAGGSGERVRPISRSYLAQVRLSDQTVVTFRQMLPVTSPSLPLRVVGLLVLLGASVAALSVWSVRRLTRPLTRLADAASGLARNLNQPPLPETGPQEVARAAQAFNAMQRDLKRLIDTRAQALSAVSHDLRLPITRLRLRLEGSSDGALREKIENDLAEMETMIGHTLDFLRAGSKSEAPAPVSLDALIDGVVEDMEELGLRVVRAGKSARAVRAQPHALRRAIANLLDNARLYGGGKVTLTIDDRQDEVRVVIADRGPGIPPQDLERVCEPYFRVEASRSRHTGGTGLGLAIAKAIVEAHGGTLALASAPGEGLRVTLVLPRC